MSDNSHVIKQWAEGWSSGDMKQVVSVYTDDCVHEDVTLGVVNHGKDELTAFGDGFFAAAPGLVVELVSHCVSGDRGSAEWWFKGTQEGEVLGLPATGKPFAFRGMSAFEFTGDKICRCSDYWDLETFKRQLGY